MNIPTCAHRTHLFIAYLLFNLFVPLFLIVVSEHSALVNSVCSRLEILTW